MHCNLYSSNDILFVIMTDLCELEEHGRRPITVDSSALASDFNFVCPSVGELDLKVFMSIETRVTCLTIS